MNEGKGIVRKNTKKNVQEPKVSSKRFKKCQCNEVGSGAGFF